MLAISNDGSSVVIRASVTVSCDAATAWRVLTDYDRYASFVPTLESSHVISRDGPHVIVEQTGIVPLWLLRVPVDVVYRITEYPPKRIVSHASLGGGDTLDSEYRLASELHGVRLDYVGRLTAHRGALTSLREKAGERAIDDHFRALADAMQREARSTDPLPPEHPTRDGN